MVLRDAEGHVVDGLNYGGLVDPWVAEGYQASSGAGESGCFVQSPGTGRGFRMGPPSPGNQPDRSAGRFPDGVDNDFNCRDFLLQNAVSLAAPVAMGSENIKVSSVTGFNTGQKIFIGSGANRETAVVAVIGTPGATTLGQAAAAGKKVLLVAGVEGFTPGQTITIDQNVGKETAVVASVATTRRRFGSPGPTPPDTISVTLPLKFAHNEGTLLSGSGITLATPLTMAHAGGSPVAGNLPSPGEPNQYTRKP
jgi:hypothetical protein